MRPKLFSILGTHQQTPTRRELKRREKQREKEAKKAAKAAAAPPKPEGKAESSAVNEDDLNPNVRRTMHSFRDSRC